MQYLVKVATYIRHLYICILFFSTSVTYSQNFQKADLPDALTFLDGSTVKTKTDWEKRKKEIKNLWCDYFIGHYPKETPKLLSAKVINTRKQKDGTTRKRVVLTFDTPHKKSFEIEVWEPKELNKSALPVFLTMPFVLADDGINYQDVEPLVFEGKTYPGIQISYESGVGESSEDEYKVYYDPETNKMTWLGYTVTYFSKEKSKKFNFIKYSNWQTLEGLVLPETLTWYENENNLPTSKRNNLLFTDVKLSKETTEIDIFEVPDGAQIIE